MPFGKKLWQQLVSNLRLYDKIMEINNVRSNNHKHSSSSCTTTAFDEVACTSYARLDPYYNGLTIAHLKPLVIDMEARQGDMAEVFENKR
jgi:hypothetical protein